MFPRISPGQGVETADELLGHWVSATGQAHKRRRDGLAENQEQPIFRPRLTDCDWRLLLRCDDLILRPLSQMPRLLLLCCVLCLLFLRTLRFRHKQFLYSCVSFPLFSHHVNKRQIGDKKKSKKPHPSSASSPPPSNVYLPDLLAPSSLPFRRFLRASTLFQRIGGNPVRFWCGCGGRAIPNRSWLCTRC